MIEQLTKYYSITKMFFIVFIFSTKLHLSVINVKSLLLSLHKLQKITMLK